MSIAPYIRFLQVASQVDPEMPLQQLHCLLVIAEAAEGLSLTDLANKVGIGLATASRYVGALGKLNRRREEGLKLIESFEDPMERRKKIIRLTKKGMITVDKLVGVKHADLSTR
jgi:DNA-binding MarR family transcriptional regulator